jgi:hypothetical protein
VILTVTHHCQNPLDSTYFNNSLYTWIPLLRLATWRCDVTCSIASSSIVRRWRTLPSTLAAKNVSLYCGNPASSSHRSTHAVSSSPAGTRWGSSVTTVLCCDSRAKCSFFRWTGFCRRHSKSCLVMSDDCFNACTGSKAPSGLNCSAQTAVLSLQKLPVLA